MQCCRPRDIFCRSTGHTYLVPCGECEECLQRRKMSFVHRCEQEKLHGSYKYCYFITLTYKDEYLPFESFSVKKHGVPVSPESTGEAVVNPYDLSMFFHRFRNFAEDSIRYFACAEYGSERNTHRPHYHIILFTNLNWKDTVKTASLAWSYLIPETYLQRKLRYKLAKKLNKPVKRDLRHLANRDLFGRVQVLSVTYKRICYVAKYVNKILYSNEPIRPFYRMSKGLGDSFLQSETCILCSQQNRHFTYFENGLPVGLSRYYSKKMFTPEQMIEFQCLMSREDFPDDLILHAECIPNWVKERRSRIERQRRLFRLRNAGLVKYYA